MQHYGTPSQRWYYPRGTVDIYIMSNPMTPPIWDKAFLRVQIAEYYRRKRSAVHLLSPIDAAALNALYFHRDRAAAKLSAAIRTQRFDLAPAQAYTAVVDGRERTLYRQNIMDELVTRAVSSVLQQLALPGYSPHLYSYQKGKGALTAVAALRRYFQHHHQSIPEKKARGLFVLRRDVSAYGESIPLEERSYLWERINQLVETSARSADAASLMHLLRQSIRRRIIDVHGKSEVLMFGAPTGSSIQPVVNNLYLHPLDTRMGEIPAGFYARYGDDFLFAHPDAQVAQEAAAAIDNEMKRLQLQVSPNKRVDLYLTGAGRSSAKWPKTKGAVGVDYLGCRIGFQGEVSLKQAKAYLFLSDIQKRIRQTSALLSEESDNVRGRAICRVINETMTPHSPLAQRYAQMLQYVVDDRKQLQHLDYLLARQVAEEMTGWRSVKAFRKISYCKIRREFGLQSLVVRRNRGRKIGGGKVE